jgi:hypothetical protein
MIGSKNVFVRCDSEWILLKINAFESNKNYIDNLKLRASEGFDIWSDQGFTKRCRLSWVTNSALVYEPKCGGGNRVCGVSANDYSCPHGAYISFGDYVTPYLTYGSD